MFIRQTSRPARDELRDAIAHDGGVRGAVQRRGRRGSRRGKTRQATLVENPSHERPRLDAPSVVTVSFASVALGVPQFRGDEDDFPRRLERSSVRAIL